jgi:TolB-like protein/DNA-binding winged helix-turn-helix (wHTH) protein
MPSPQDPPLAFDDLVIDFAGRRVTRAGQAQALEPKAFDVLALLAGSPGTAFTRDQILDAVWGHRHVTPGVLNRVMTMLRHALGEEANAPHYLHTLHGVGYRFDLPGATSARTAEAVPVPDVAAPGVATVPTRRWGDRVSWRAWAWLVGTTVVLAWVAAWWTGHDADLRHPPVATSSPAPTLIVMPLKPIGEPGSTPAIAAGLSEELISELARIPGLRVIALESTSLATAAGTPLAEQVTRLGITHALEGSLRQSGEAMRVNIRLTEMGSGHTLWTQDFDREAADVLALQREIAQAVATALTLKLALAPTPRGGDAEFLRRYFAAHALVGLFPRSRGADIEWAEAEFRELVYLRPDDARTHAGLARALESRAFQHPELADALRHEAAREAAVALGLDPQQAEAHSVQAAAACRAEDWERCVGLAESAIAAAPSDSPMRFRHAMVLASLGYLDRAEAMIRAGKARDPLNGVWGFALGRLLDTQGRHDAARVAFERAGPGTSPYGGWFNAVWRGDLDAAEAIAGKLGAADDSDDTADSLRPSYLAATRALRDPAQWPQARAAMDRWEAQSGMMNFTRVLAPDADAATMLAGLTTVRRRSYSTWDLLVWTHDLPYLRRGPAFQRYLADTGILAYWRKHGFPPQCTQRPAGVECR